MPASLLHKLIVAPLAYVPKPIVWQLSQRYVAGEDLAAAVRTVRTINSIGCSATVDVLGEDSTQLAEVETARDLYFGALAGIEEDELDCNASVKLSDLGLRFDTQLTFDVV